MLCGDIIELPFSHESFSSGKVDCFACGQQNHASSSNEAKEIALSIVEIVVQCMSSV